MSHISWPRLLTLFDVVCPAYQVEIQVIDVNDNPPTIHVSPAPDLGPITEHDPKQIFLAHITVRDDDSGVNGEVTCQISDDHFRLKKFPEVTDNSYLFFLISLSYFCPTVILNISVARSLSLSLSLSLAHSLSHTLTHPLAHSL